MKFVYRFLREWRCRREVIILETNVAHLLIVLNIDIMSVCDQLRIHSRFSDSISYIKPGVLPLI